MRIIFMGTPEFAIPSLDILVKNNYSIGAVITAPDKPAGRGQKISLSAVKNYAVENKLPVLQPEKLKAPAFLTSLQTLNADLFIVVAFRMLPESVWRMPPLGTFNLHASLLPQYRGAAPIQRALINGETETGVTTFFIQQEIDTGDILFSRRTPIGANENAGELHDRLALMGADLVLKTVRSIEANDIRPACQNIIGTTLHHAPKIFKDDCKINWNNQVDVIFNLIRGLCPSPGAFTFLNNLVLKIFKAEKEYIQHNDTPGSFKTDGKNFLKVAASDGYILVRELQLQGKKIMDIGDFLRGYKFKNT